MGEFSRIVDEGTPVATADRAVAGLAPMPPFVLLGLVGPTIALHNSETLNRAFGDRFHVSPSLRRLVGAGKPGYYVMERRAGRCPTRRCSPWRSVPRTRSSSTVEQARERILEVLAEEVGLMLSRGRRGRTDGHRPRDDHGGRLPVLERRPLPPPRPRGRLRAGRSDDGSCPPASRACPPADRPSRGHGTRSVRRSGSVSRRCPDISQLRYPVAVTTTTTSDTYLTRIGTLIRDARRHQGLTQSELADLLGTSQSAVARIEQGKQNLVPRDAGPGRREARQRVRLAGSQRPAAPEDRRRAEALRLDPRQDEQERRRRPPVREPAQQGPHDAAQPGPHRGGQPDHRGAHLDRRARPVAPRQQRPRDHPAGAARPREHRRRGRAAHAHGDHVPRPAAPRAPAASSCRMPGAATSARAPSSRTCPRSRPSASTSPPPTASTRRRSDPDRHPQRAIVLTERGDTVTENVLMAAARHPGTTVIRNASPNYMVQDLCFFLQALGVGIEGIGTTTLTVTGVRRHRRRHRVLPVARTRSRR